MKRVAGFGVVAVATTLLGACSGGSGGQRAAHALNTASVPRATVVAPSVDPYSPAEQSTPDPEPNDTLDPAPVASSDPNLAEPAFTDGEQAYISAARFYLPRRKFSDEQVVVIGHRACALIAKFAVVGAGERVASRYHLDEFTGGFLAGAAPTSGICGA